MVSPAVVNKAITLTGKALIRCRISDGKSAVYSAAIPVEIVERQPLTASPFRAARRVDTPSTYNAEAPGVYTVTINYVLENGKPVATPYESSVPEGTSIKAEVLNPVIPGYKAYFNGEESVSVTVNIPNPVENVTYTVVYKPTNVNYTVIHYKQNLDDDKYTEVERENKQGLTNSPVPDVAKNKRRRVHRGRKRDKTGSYRHTGAGIGKGIRGLLRSAVREIDYCRRRLHQN